MPSHQNRSDQSGGAQATGKKATAPDYVSASGAQKFQQNNKGDTQREGSF